MTLYAMFGSETVEVQDPEAFVRVVVKAGEAELFILEAGISLRVLEALYVMEQAGLVEQKKGVPTRKLIEGTERILTMLREELREAEK